ncbi:hypothetical protein [Flavobacterium psychraquaticum]|uniref:hypothetical protein n=1 Tax=Flavobacterium psychraquaticum TaxID=3103958 RepID=UPI002ACEF8F8|nr:hypothetical protein [Flavobacterium sp. LB-N7T]
MKNKPTLLFYISVSLTILLFCSIIIIGILLSKLNFDNNKYHTLFKYIQKTEITNQDIEKQQFKEDYYIEQQSSDTSLILTVFGVTAIVFGVFSYTLFESRINEHKNYYSDKIADQDSKYSILKFHLDDLLKNIASDKAYENMIKAKENYIKQNYEWYIYFSLEAVSNFSEYFMLTDNQELKNFTTESQITLLKDVVKNINENSITVKNLEHSVTQKYITNILRFQNIEITNLICKIKSVILD